MKTLNVGDGIHLPLKLVTASNGVLAKKGAGKTSAAIVLLEEMYAAGVPVVSIDPKGDHYGIRTSADGKHPGLPIPVFGGRHGDIPLEPSAGALIADLVLDKHLSCVLDVSEFTKADVRRFLHAFGDRLYRHADRDPLHLFLEECHEYLPQQVRGEDAALVNVWQRIVKQGRYKGIGVTMLSQRSAAVNKDVLTQIDNLFVLRTTSPQDRDAIKGWIDVHAEARTILAELPSLQNGECWLWQPEEGEPIRFRFRMRNTFDAGATPEVGQRRITPTTLADVDLTEISAAMADTIEKAKSEDPKELRKELASARTRLAALERDLEAARTATPETVIEKVEVPLFTPADWEDLEQVRTALEDLTQTIAERLPVARIEQKFRPNLIARPDAPPWTVQDKPVGPAAAPAVKQPRPSAQSGSLRSGAHRMVEALARMHPLRLTKAQWGTVAKLKTSGGTWSTYLSDIRRLGLIDENSSGYSLTDAGFDYLGTRPSPMTANELQDHYRSILRSGAAKMLDALIDAYPNPLTRADLGDAAGIAITGGTFSTYLSDLTRNGLAEKHGDQVLATEILMMGAEQ